MRDDDGIVQSVSVDRFFIAVFVALALLPRMASARPPEIDQLATLYKELIRFKDEPRFKEVGFGQCCQYHDWMVRVERLRDKASSKVWLQVGVFPGDLVTLGLDFLHSKGAKTSYAREMIPQFEAALFPKRAKGGFTGKMSATDRACKDLGRYQRQMELIEAQDYAGAAKIISDDEACPLVQKGTPMRGPLDTRKQREDTYVLVEAQGIGRVWVMDDAVEFVAHR
jgi:hypothetical protein